MDDNLPLAIKPIDGTMKLHQLTCDTRLQIVHRRLQSNLFIVDPLFSGPLAIRDFFSGPVIIQYIFL